jgi:hypothetical protein
MKINKPSALVILHVLAVFVAPVVAQDAKYRENFTHDFRGKPLPAELTFFGKGVEQYAKEEPQGLRFTVPKERDNYQPVGIKTLFAVQGDFEITVAVEILHADVPAAGFGVGATLYVNKTIEPTHGATLGRLMRSPGRSVVVWDRSPGEKEKFEGGDRPCEEKLVRLRLKRNGTLWSYQWAAGEQGDEFAEIHQCRFGDAKIKQVTLRCATAGQPCKADVRFLTLTIRSGGVVAAAPSTAAADTATPAVATTTARTGSHGWLMATVVIVGLLVLFGVVAGVIGLLVVKSRRATAPGRPVKTKRE